MRQRYATTRTTNVLEKLPSNPGELEFESSLKRRAVSHESIVVVQRNTYSSDYDMSKIDILSCHLSLSERFKYLAIICGLAYISVNSGSRCK
jgi:hypothetical protein